MKLCLVTLGTVLGLALAAAPGPAPASSGSSKRSPTFEFGRTGGNIEPYSVRVTSRGAITTTGPVHLRNPDKMLSRAAQMRLLKLALREHFFSLPRRVGCAGALPDFASSFVTVSTSAKTRTVTVHGDCSARFQKLLGALEAAVGIPLAER